MVCRSSCYMQLPDRHRRQVSPTIYFYHFRRDTDLFPEQNISLRLARMGYAFNIFLSWIVKTHCEKVIKNALAVEHRSYFTESQELYIRRNMLLYYILTCVTCDWCCSGVFIGNSEQILIIVLPSIFYISCRWYLTFSV